MNLRKGLLIILDGLGDRPVPALEGRTPLEDAATPHLDAAARDGCCGLLHPYQPWVPVGTQVGMSLLMGLAPADVPLLSRGPVEAAGSGLSLEPGDIAIRCNFATLEDDGSDVRIVNRRAGRIHEDREALRDALNDMDLGLSGIRHRVALATGHRAVLVLSGPDLSSRITDTDPGAGYAKRGLLPSRAIYPHNAAASRTAEVLNVFLTQSRAVLRTHPVNTARTAAGLPPANGLLTRGAGSAHQLRNQVTHLGLPTATISGDRTALGLARLFGFTPVHHPTFTANPETSLANKVAATQEALTSHDLVFLHIKGADVLAHDKNPTGKRDFLEQIDAALAPLLEGPHAVAVTADHSTASTMGRHVGDPVPTLLLGPGGRRDDVTAYSESTCQKGGLGHLSASALLCALLDQMNRLPNYQSHQYVLFDT